MAFDVSRLVLATRRLSVPADFFELPLGPLAAVGLEPAAVGEATISSVFASGAAKDLARALAIARLFSPTSAPIEDPD